MQLYIYLTLCIQRKRAYIYCLSLPGHHQLDEQQPGHEQAAGHPAAGGACQPVWIPHREGRLQDQGDERGVGGDRCDHDNPLLLAC